MQYSRLALSSVTGIALISDWKQETPGNCVQKEMKVRKCRRCGLEQYVYGDYGDHDWGEWHVVIPAAPGKFGLEERICKIEASHRETRDLLPLPQEGEYKKTIRVAMPDGSEYVNVLHITTNGFWMEHANCEGQDCVKQGEVTLENREERILWNMIICLPHQLSAELITREEAEQMLK